MVAWIGLFLTCYGVSALCLIKGYHPKIPLKQEKGYVVLTTENSDADKL